MAPEFNSAADRVPSPHDPTAHKQLNRVSHGGRNVLGLVVLVAVSLVGVSGALGQGSGRGSSPNQQGYYRCWACNGSGRVPNGALCWSCNGSGIKNVRDANSRNVARSNNPYRPVNSFNNNPGLQSCFIATAAYGSPWEDQVITLRRFRENWLLTNAIGQVGASGQPYVHLVSTEGKVMARGVIINGQQMPSLVEPQYWAPASLRRALPPGGHGA